MQFTDKKTFSKYDTLIRNDLENKKGKPPTVDQGL